MIKVLYVSNIEVPYRTAFFNQLSKKVDLTVLYERLNSVNRNEEWTKSVKSSFKKLFLKGINIKNEYAIDLSILKYVLSKRYDIIIFGCLNSPSQIIAMRVMKILKRKYILNLDGEYFTNINILKKTVKTILAKKAYKYLVAGEYSAKMLKSIIKDNNIYTYHFSSLTNDELKDNARVVNKNNNNTVIVVGQYFNYKGLDVALECAKIDSKINYKFIGSGIYSKELQKRVYEMNLKNVKIIPFLSKKELYFEYQNCKCLLLPSRKECWGLVINEAASFGCPIIATNGSGAAMDFVEKKWIANGAKEMHQKIVELEKKNYNKKRLLEISKKYSIENMVDETINCIQKEKKNER